MFANVLHCALCIKAMCFDAERCENRQKVRGRDVLMWYEDTCGSLSEGHVMQGSIGPPLPLLQPYCRVSTADRANANEGHAESQWLNRERGSRDKLAACPLPHKTKWLSMVNHIILQSELTLSINALNLALNNKGLLFPFHKLRVKDQKIHQGFYEHRLLRNT